MKKTNLKNLLGFLLLTVAVVLMFASAILDIRALPTIWRALYVVVTIVALIGGLSYALPRDDE